MEIPKVGVALEAVEAEALEELILRLLQEMPEFQEQAELAAGATLSEQLLPAALERLEVEAVQAQHMVLLIFLHYSWVLAAVEEQEVQEELEVVLPTAMLALAAAAALERLAAEAALVVV